MSWRHPQSQSAMALPMVLWTIAILGSVTLLLAGIIQNWISEETHAGKQFRARQQALSGLALAMDKSVALGDPLLSHQEGDEGYKVVIKDESGLINPNTLLAEIPDRRDLLEKLFTAWGLDQIAVETAGDGLYDWQSSSPFKSLHGAKKTEYAAVGRAGFPPGAPFTASSEMELVLGFDPVIQAKPDWRSYFTTYYNGKVNILHAPKSILTDFLGLTADQADQWISLRNGKDGLEGTSDDLTVDSVDQVANLIGCNPAQRAILQDACDTSGSVRRIESTGTCNGVKRVITVILSAGSTDDAQASGNLLGWSEQ
jgi:hypothetical protein